MARLESAQDRGTGGSTVVVTKDDTILALQIIVEYINDKIVPGNDKGGLNYTEIDILTR